MIRRATAWVLACWLLLASASSALAMLPATKDTLFSSSSRSAAAYVAAVTPCHNAQFLEIYIAVTAGSGTAVGVLETAPTSSGPWVTIGTTTSLSNGGETTLYASRGTASSLGMFYRLTVTVSTAAATFEAYGVSA
jgi:hypothetical protein